jgi:hypothetical protein
LVQIFQILQLLVRLASPALMVQLFIFELYNNPVAIEKEIIYLWIPNNEGTQLWTRKRSIDARRQQFIYVPSYLVLKCIYFVLTLTPVWNTTRYILSLVTFIYKSVAPSEYKYTAKCLYYILPFITIFGHLGHRYLSRDWSK